MAKFDIDVTELTDYARRQAGASEDGALAFTGIAAKYRDLTRETAKELVPKDTLELHDSIQNVAGEASRMGLSADWHVTAGHASPIEYGFIHYLSGEFIGPQPYVRPSLFQHTAGYVAEIGAAAKDQIRVRNPGRVTPTRGSFMARKALR